MLLIVDCNVHGIIELYKTPLCFDNNGISHQLSLHDLSPQIYFCSPLIYVNFALISLCCSVCTAFVFLNRCSSRYIVYDVAQINLKYLLKIKFNYQTSLWWEGPSLNPRQWKQRPLLPPNASASFSATEDVWQRSDAIPRFSMVLGNLLSLYCFFIRFTSWQPSLVMHLGTCIPTYCTSCS